MSGTELNIRVFFSNESTPGEICKLLNSSKKELEVDFSDALSNIPLKKDVLEPGSWFMSDSATWKKCLTIRLYGGGEEDVICKILESLGAVLIAIKGFNDQVAYQYEYGWINGKPVKQRTLNSELKKLDPYIAFYEAIKKGHARKVREFIEEGIDFRAPLQGDMTPLMHAAFYGKASVIKALVEAGADVNALISGNKTALLYSLLNLIDQYDHDDLSAIEALLEYGANPNILSSNPAKSSLGNIRSRSEDILPLMLAAECSIDAVDLLIKYNADVNLSNSQGYTPLMFALEVYGAKSIPCVMLLIKKGADVNAEDRNGVNCLGHVSSSSENDVILRSFGAVYKPIEYTQDNKDNLLNAIWSDDLAMVRKLSKEMDVNDALDMGNFKTWAINNAISARRYEIVQFLLDSGADLQKIDAEYIEARDQRESLLTCACEAGRLNTVKALIDGGINVSFTNKYGRSALDYVFESEFPEEYSESLSIVRLLIDHNVPVGSSLKSAIEYGDQDIIDLLINADALDKELDYGKVFCEIVSNRNTYFIKKYAKWMIDNGFSFSNLTMSLNNESGLEFVKFALPVLIENGLEISGYYENTYYYSPLNSVTTALVSSGSIKNKKSKLLIEILDILLNAGAVPDEGLKERDYTLIMMLQKKEDRKPVIEKLLEFGADINHVSDLEAGSSYDLLVNHDVFEGHITALILAVANGHLDLVKLFIEHGADPKHVSDVGSAIQVAERYNRKSVVSYLKNELGV